jgi:hypothetical protein
MLLTVRLPSLVDIEECTGSSFEILGAPSAGEENPMYTRAFRVDDEGRDVLIEIARQHGKCGTCSSSMVSERYALVVRGFRAEVHGTVTNLSSTVDGVMVPATIQLSNASRSNDATVICGVEQVAPAPAPSAGSAASDLIFRSAFELLILAPLFLIL